MSANHLNEAAVELKTATDLVLAAAEVMQLVGKLTKEQYEELIRPMMMPPYVKSENFSGLMLWEHSYLINLFKRMSPTFKALPLPLKVQQAKFITAYRALCIAHKEVCQKFIGDEAGSLRGSEDSAIDILDKFSQNRLRLISPQINPGSCPVRTI